MRTSLVKGLHTERLGVGKIDRKERITVNMVIYQGGKYITIMVLWTQHTDNRAPTNVY